MDIHPLDTEQIGLKTLEKHLIRNKGEISLRIGVPKENSIDEKRVSLTPGGVPMLKANGHHVIIEKGAGEDAKFTDQDYTKAGAEIALSSINVFKKSELILKAAPLTNDEFNLLEADQALISALHLGSQTKGYFDALSQKNVTGIGYEFIRGVDKEFPIVRMMHEITGTIAVQIAAHYLESRSNGQGIMLGGISGVLPATYALNNVLVPYILAIGDAGGIKECLWNNVALRNGTYSYKKTSLKNRLVKCLKFLIAKLKC